MICLQERCVYIMTQFVPWLKLLSFQYLVNTKVESSLIYTLSIALEYIGAPSGSMVLSAVNYVSQSKGRKFDPH